MHYYWFNQYGELWQAYSTSSLHYSTSFLAKTFSSAETTLDRKAIKINRCFWRRIGTLASHLIWLLWCALYVGQNKQFTTTTTTTTTTTSISYEINIFYELWTLNSNLKLIHTCCFHCSSTVKEEMRCWSLIFTSFLVSFSFTWKYYKYSVHKITLLLFTFFFFFKIEASNEPEI